MSIVHSTTYNKILSLLSSYGGRDKLAKVIHYSARIAVWYFAKVRNDPTSSEKAERFRRAIGSHRRILWLFNWMFSLPSLYTQLLDTKNAEKNPFFRTLLILSDLADILYYAEDNITFMHEYGFIKLKDKTVDFLDNIVGSWTWLFSVSVWLLYNYRNYLRLKSQRIQLVTDGQNQPENYFTRQQEIEKLDTQLFNYKLDFVKLIADLQLAIFFCFPKTWPSQYVGVFGVTNAVTSLYQMWIKK